MSHLFDRLNFLQKKSLGTFAGGHGELTREDRDWEEVYRNRWQHDKIVRSTHGVNCTGSCSWKIYVKCRHRHLGDPADRLSAHSPRPAEPRAARLRARGELQLVSLQRQPAEVPDDPQAAAAGLAAMRATDDARSRPGQRSRGPGSCASPTSRSRGKGGFVRAGWDEVNRDHRRRQCLYREDLRPRPRVRLLADPGDVDGVAMPRARAICSLLGGICMSFYDWYCDLPPACPQTWGEQTDVPESADWYNSGFLILWGSNVPQTRTPDAHFYTEARYRGAKIGGDLPGLFRSREVRRHLAAARSRAPTRARDGDGPRDPAGVPRRPAGRVLRRLLPPLHRHAAAGAARRARRPASPGTAAARIGLRWRARRGQQSRMEDRRPIDETTGRDRRAQRLGRVPLGRDRASGSRRKRSHQRRADGTGANLEQIADGERLAR